MAGDWMKIEVSTPTKPRVLAIAAKLNIDPDEAFGKLFRTWAWFDSHTVDGNAPSVTSAQLERIIGVTGLAQAMLDVGWLEVSEDGLVMPRFDEHNGTSAKKRAQGQRRAIKARSNAKEASRSRNAPSVTSALPEKRREEKSKDTPYSPPDGGEVAAIYDAYPRKVGKRQAVERIKQAVARITAGDDRPASETLWPPPDPAAWLLDRVKVFAKSPAGQAGQFTPQPATFFNQARYSDDPTEWQRKADRNQPDNPSRVRGDMSQYEGKF